MPPRKSKPKAPTQGAKESDAHFQERLDRFNAGAGSKSSQAQKSSQPGIQKRARSTASKQKQQKIQAPKGFTQQIDGSIIDLNSSPPRESEAANILNTFSIGTYGDLVIANPSASKNFKPEYDRGYRYTTLNEAIERYGSSARHVIPFTHFYQDRAGWWHAYVEIDSP